MPWIRARDTRAALDAFYLETIRMKVTGLASIEYGTQFEALVHMSNRLKRPTGARAVAFLCARVGYDPNTLRPLEPAP